AHPTGRRLGERESSDVDLDEVFHTAVRHGKAVEINCSARADLSDVNARRAAELGVLLAVCTDTHHLDEVGTIEHGVAMAGRAWLEPDRVINTWPTAKFLDWVRSRPRDAARPRSSRRRS